MTDKETRPKPIPNPREPLIEERRSLTEAAIVATPVAVLLQPVVGALADKYLGQKPSDPSPPAPPQQEQLKE